MRIFRKMLSIARAAAPGTTSSSTTLTPALAQCAATMPDDIRKDGRLAKFVQDRYSSYNSGIGAKIEKGKTSFAELEAYMLKKGEAAPNSSGRQEFLENLINEFI